MPPTRLPRKQTVKCPHCDATFTRKSSLNRHLQSTHEEGSTFRCHECDKSFSRQDLLNRHVLNMHRGEGYTDCLHCGRSCRNDYIDKHRSNCRQRHVRERSNANGPGVFTVVPQSVSRSLIWQQSIGPCSSKTPNCKQSANIRRIRFVREDPPPADDVLQRAVDALAKNDTKALQCLMKWLPPDCGSHLLDRFYHRDPYAVLGTGAENDEAVTLAFWEILVRLGADVNRKDRLDRTPLFDAVARNQIRVLKFLLQSGVDPNTQDFAGSTALHRVVAYNRVEAARILISHGAACDVDDQRGRTPVEVACLYLGDDARIEIVEMILDAQGDKYIDVVRRQSMLEKAINYGQISIVRRLVGSGDLELNPKAGSQTSPFLHMAIMNGSLDIVNTLLSAGADPNRIDGLGRSPLYTAAYYDDLPILQVLLQQNVDVNAGHSCALYGALLGAEPKVLEALLDAGARWDNLESRMRRSFALPGEVDYFDHYHGEFPRREEQIRILERYGIDWANVDHPPRWKGPIILC